jgi:hypothetical protein
VGAGVSVAAGYRGTGSSRKSIPAAGSVGNGQQKVAVEHVHVQLRRTLANS